ncbi:MAG: hypothetical protein ACKPKO_37040, partial [Candidatus Fonsibacter sp.]
DMPPDIQTDILDLDYKTYSPHDFDAIWASPPGTDYSMAKTTGVKNIEEANKISQRTIDIVRYFDPKYWIIENPQTGNLKEPEFVTDLPFNDVDYCKYGMPYRKRTRLWNNVECWDPRPFVPEGLRQYEQQQTEAQGNRTTQTARREGR